MSVPEIPRAPMVDARSGKLAREWIRWFQDLAKYLTGLVVGVSSTFGRTGAVVAAASDYDASQVDNDSGVAGSTVADALDALDTGLASSSEAGNVYMAVAVADLSQTISDPPTQTEVQDISTKIDDLLAKLRTAGSLSS